MLDKLDRVIRVDAKFGPQDMVKEILEAVQSMDDRIEAVAFPFGHLLIRSFAEQSVIRQIVPGQIEFLPPVQVPANRGISYNLDLLWGNSESIVRKVKEQLTLALTFEYIKGYFITYGEPIYQGGGIYAVQWGFIAVVEGY